MFVDTREPPIFHSYIRDAMYPEPVTVTKLDCADVLILDNCPEGHTVGVERKTISDLLGSLSDGRLRKQLDRMLEAYSHPMLLIEGTMVISREGVVTQENGPANKGGRVMIGRRETGWHYGAVQMALLSIQLHHPQVTVIWTAGKTETADALRVLYNRCKKGCVYGKPGSGSTGEGAGAGAAGEGERVQPGNGTNHARGSRPVEPAKQHREGDDRDGGFGDGGTDVPHESAPLVPEPVAAGSAPGEAVVA